MNERARKAAAASGLMPLDYLLSIMRDENQSQDERKDAAKAAAPYLHARLAQTENKNTNTNVTLSQLSDAELDQRVRIALERAESAKTDQAIADGICAVEGLRAGSAPRTDH